MDDLERDIGQLVGPRGLIIALIIRSTLDLSDSEMHIRRDARVWFNHPGSEPWSFKWCCEHMNFTSSSFISYLQKRGEQLF